MFGERGLICINANGNARGRSRQNYCYLERETGVDSFEVELRQTKVHGLRAGALPVVIYNSNLSLRNQHIHISSITIRIYGFASNSSIQP